MKAPEPVEAFVESECCHPVEPLVGRFPPHVMPAMPDPTTAIR